MNKKLLFLLAGMFLFVLTGCSGSGQDGKYEKLMANADKAMEDFEIDEALKNYKKILEMDSKDLSYGDTRLMIVNSLVESTEELKSQVDQLETEVADVKEAYEKLDYSDKKIDQLEEFSHQITMVLNRLGAYPNTNLYKETAEIKKEFDENIETKIVKGLKEGIDKDLEKTLFEDAKTKVDKLTRIQGSFAIKIAGLDKYDEKINKERNKYISFPYKITERNQVIYENADIGKVIFLGEGMKNGSLKAFYKFEGDVRTVAEKLGLSTKYIFADGNYDQSSSFDYSYYDDYVIAEHSVSSDDKAIKRIDYRFNFMEADTMQTITLGDAEKEMTIDGIAAYEEKSFTTNHVFEDEEKKIELTSMTIQRDQIILNGKITSKEDIIIDGNIYIARPYLNNLNNRSFREELFSGISKEFKVEVGLGSPLHGAEKFVHLNFLGFHTNIDLNSGKEFKGSEAIFTGVTYGVNDQARLQEFYDSDEKALFQDTADKTYTNVISMKQYYGFFSGGEEPALIEIPISQKYKTLTIDVGVDKRYSEAAYGTSLVTFESAGGKVLKEVNLAASAKTVPVEIDVSNVDKLVIKVVQTRGDLGQQTVLLGNGVFKMK